MYGLIKKLLFLQNPEKAHHSALKLFKIAQNLGIDKLFSISQSWESYKNKEIIGLNFPNPIGLAAGFDKDGLYLNQWDAMGFGSVEVGTVTPLAQEGNPKPRLFRLTKDEALINRMGFNNLGVDNLYNRIVYYRQNNPNSKLIIGGNIGKNKITENAFAYKDYVRCIEVLGEVVDYFTVNISSPNTPGLRELQNKDELSQLLESVQNANQKLKRKRPLMLKISPDMDFAQIDDIVYLTHKFGFSGLIATNTTIGRNIPHYTAKEIENYGNGGLSGKPLTQLSSSVLQHILNNKPKDLNVFSSGGIMNAKEGILRLEMGADIIQLYTGFVYKGINLLKETFKLYNFSK